VPLPAPFGNLPIDVRPALAGVLTPKAEVLKLQLAAAYAKGYCGGGKLQLEGSSKLAGLSVLGVELPTDQVVNQAINVLGQGSINLGQLDITKLGLPPAVAALGQSVLQPILSQVNIPIPELLASVKIVPGAQTRTATSLTQTALGVSIDVAGQPVARLAIGRASVGADSVDCAGAPPRSASEAALQCTNRRLVLIDVLQGKKKVHLYGAADKRYIGKTVRIFFRASGRRVATTKVRSDGTFRVNAKLPRKSLIGTNAARYQARVGKERSLKLKLTRRMIVRRVRVEGGQVKILGRVVRPLAKPARTIEVRRRVSCKKWEVVKRIRPSRSGAFSTSVAAPDKALAGTYRFATRVRKNRHNAKTYPTFTLPRYVDLT
jgi:hypothetical protein